MTQSKPENNKIAIIGGGTAALTTAYFLSPKFDVTIYEKEKAIGQKLLVAGKGGFNLTNSITGNDLANKYTPKNFLNKSLTNFDSQNTIDWMLQLGIKTFVGTSGRIYPEKVHKPISVLQAIKSFLINKNVKILNGYKFIGFDKNQTPIIENNNEQITLEANYYIFSLGGASWPATGSDGKWINEFNKIGVKTIPFEPSNCGINIKWGENILQHHLGKPIKNANLIVDKEIFTGEAVITEYGLEGNLVYSAIPKIRESLKNGIANIYLDFKPNNTEHELHEKITNEDSSSDIYKSKLNLNSTELALLKSFTSKNEFTDKSSFIKNVKKLEIKIESLRPIEEAISTVGGISIDELDEHFSLKTFPKLFTIGEMVDWDAPTGGFLLQACFSMGKYVADHLNKNL